MTGLAKLIIGWVCCEATPSPRTPLKRSLRSHRSDDWTSLDTCLVFKIHLLDIVGVSVRRDHTNFLHGI